MRERLEASQTRSVAALAACFVLACTMQAALPGSWMRCVWVVAVFGVVLYCALVDVRYRIVPNAAVALLCLLGLASAGVSAALPAGSALDAAVALGLRVSGAAALAAFMLALSLAFESRGREGMGGGDAKLVFSLALCFGPSAALAVLGLSCVLVLAHQAGCAVWRRVRGLPAPTLRSTVAFAPAISLAVWLVAAL